MSTDYRAPMLSTRLSYTTEPPLQSMSMSMSQTDAALACRDHVKILKLSPRDCVCTGSLQLSVSTHNFTLTDVAWCHRNSSLLAASATNGAVVVFDVKERRQIWTTGEESRSVNKICWHRTEENILATSNQDGTIKIWDYRSKKAPCQSTFASNRGPSRNVQFNPLNSNTVAAIYENGGLIIWDRRKLENNIVTKINAHTLCGLTLCWSQHDEHCLASGGSDKTVKVWDLRRHSQGGPDNTAGHGDTGAYHRPAHVIHTATAVHQVIWRPSEQVSTQLATISGTDGDVSVWDIAMPHIPLCVLRGHKDACMGFDWLDTPADWDGRVSTEESVTDMPGRNLLTTMKNQSFRGMSLWQHVFSASKDGAVLVQDLRMAHFPRRHMSSQAMAMSPLGHFAIHSGHIIQGDTLTLRPTPSPSTLPSCWWHGSLPGWLAAQIKHDTSHTHKDSLDSRVSKSPDHLSTVSDCESTDKLSCLDGHDSGTGLPWRDRETGVIFVGNGPLLQVNKSLQKRREEVGSPSVAGGDECYEMCWGGEGAPADPCTVRLLALKYIWYLDPSEGGVEEVCRRNSLVTEECDLPGQTALWRAVYVMLSGMQFERRDAIATEKPGLYTLFQQLLLQLLDAGDCQHLVTVCEVLRMTETDGSNCGIFSVVTSLPESRRHEAYVSYWELLRQLKLTEVACRLSICSDIPMLVNFSRKGVEMKQDCAKCGKELPRAADTGGVRLPWCLRCKGIVGVCIVCHGPVCGLFLWCPVCGHGGHKECMHRWFDRDYTDSPSACSCPSGCGHVCVIPGTTPKEERNREEAGSRKGSKAGDITQSRKWTRIRSIYRTISMSTNNT